MFELLSACILLSRYPSLFLSFALSPALFSFLSLNPSLTYTIAFSSTLPNSFKAFSPSGHSSHGHFTWECIRVLSMTALTLAFKRTLSLKKDKKALPAVHLIISYSPLCHSKCTCQCDSACDRPSPHPLHLNQAVDFKSLLRLVI